MQARLKRSIGWKSGVPLTMPSHGAAIEVRAYEQLRLMRSMISSLIDRCSRILSTHCDAPDRFEMAVNAVYSRVLPEGGIALDLGAHKGKHTLPMAKAVGPEGTTYAFEPIFEKFSQLVAALDDANLTQVAAFNVCCGDRCGVVTFTYLPDDPGKSAIKIRPELQTSSVRKAVQSSLCVRIDSFLGQLDALDFVKIDVEGAELTALRGMSELIGRTRPIIHVEIGLPSLKAFEVDPVEIFDFFGERDYDLLDVLGTPLPDRQSYLVSVEKTRVYDYFAVPRGDGRRSAVIDAIEATWRG